MERRGGLAMFSGISFHTLDAKNRLIIPSKIRDEISRIDDPNFVYLSKGNEGCLFLFSVKQWERVARQFSSASYAQQKVRVVARLFFANSEKIPCDRQGRIVVPDRFKQLANLDKEVVIVGMSDQAEIWDKGAWDAYHGKNISSYDEVAEEVYGGLAPASSDQPAGGE